MATQVEDALDVIYRDWEMGNNRIVECSNNRMADGDPTIRKFENSKIRRFPKVAVMGCVVNGPGEAKGADIALCGGDGEFLLYVRGNFVEKVSQEDAVRKVVEHVVSFE